MLKKHTAFGVINVVLGIFSSLILLLNFVQLCLKNESNS